MFRRRRDAVRIMLSVFMAVSACRVVAAQTAGLTLAHLETNAAPEPLGIDDRAPRLSWAVGGERPRERLGAAGVVRDGALRRGRMERPMDRRAGTEGRPDGSRRQGR